MSSSHKKVIVRRLTGDVLPGYLAASGFLERKPASRTVDEPAKAVLSLLDLGGRVIPVPLDEVKMVSYVRDFNLSDPGNPERLTRRAFLARPRAEGLWVRLTFRTGDLLEGLAPVDLALVDDLLDDGGLFLLPPDTRSNTQRIYVPRAALATLQVLAVVTSPSKRRPTVVPVRGDNAQEELFRSSLPVGEGSN